MALLMTFSHSHVSSTLLVHEVIRTNFSLTVTVSTCTSIFFSQRINRTWNSVPAKLNDFSSLAWFTRFVRIEGQTYHNFYRSGTNRSPFLVTINSLWYFVHQRLLVHSALTFYSHVCLCVCACYYAYSMTAYCLTYVHTEF